MRPDRRRAEHILSEARWQPLRHLASRLDLTGLRDVDRLLKLCEAEGISHIDDISEALIDRIDHGSISHSYQLRLARALAALLPGTILADRAARNAALRLRQWTATRPRPKIGRIYVAKKSVPERDLPAEWQAALADMRAGLGSASDRAPAPKMVDTIAMKVRQLAKSAADRCLNVDLSKDALAALHEDMNARGVSSITKRATCSALGRFAQYIAAPAEIRGELRRLTAFHDTNAAKEIKRKEITLQNVDLSAARVLAKAKELLSEASTVTNPRSALTRRNEAFCLAVFSIIPLRLSDTRCAFGEELTWDGAQWALQLTTSKNGVEYACRIDKYLTPYIDAMVLHGLDPAYLEEARADCLSRRRPVLMNASRAGVGYNYVSDVWRRHVGTGEHITRTEIHETFAVARGAEGTELALAACAQTSPRSAAHYHGERLRRARLAAMQEVMLALAEGLPDDAFGAR